MRENDEKMPKMKHWARWTQTRPKNH